MFGKSAALTACCALAASAFLLPPSVTVTEEDTLSILPFFALDARTQRIILPCTTCNWAYPSNNFYDELLPVEDGTFKAPDGVNDVIFNFTISQDGRALMLNDRIVYPHQRARAAGESLADVYLEQILSTTTEQNIDDGLYSSVLLKVDHAGIVEELPAAEQVIPLRLRVFRLNNQAVDLDEIFIQLVDSVDGLLILSLERSSTNTVPNLEKIMPIIADLPAHKPEHASHERPCHLPGPFCALGRFIGSTFGSGRKGPCPGRKLAMENGRLPTHIHAMPGSRFGRPEFSEDMQSDFDAMPEDFDQMMKFRPHHGHRHHGHHHGFFHFVSRGILAVLLPIMAGITVGIIVSVAGLLFGRLLGWLWFTAFRSSRRGYSSVSADETHDVKEDVVEQSLPPYEDSPAYEAVIDEKTSS